MKNALVYVVNNNQTYVDMMVNSINSFFHWNPGLVNNTTVYVLTNEDVLRVDGITPGVKWTIINNMSYDYFTLTVSNPKHNHMVYFRYEVFLNEIFRDIDNLVYVDGDTEFCRRFNLFDRIYDRPIIGMVTENGNNINGQYGDLKVDTYCNAGFMFMTPKLIGYEVMLDIFNELVKMDNYKFRYQDQDALNVVLNQERFKPYVKYISKVYNCAWCTCGRNWMKYPNPIMLHHTTVKTYAKKYLGQIKIQPSKTIKNKFSNPPNRVTFKREK